MFLALSDVTRYNCYRKEAMTMGFAEYLIRIVTAWALLRLASLVVKDTESLVRASAQAKDSHAEVESAPAFTDEEITAATEE